MLEIEPCVFAAGDYIDVELASIVATKPPRSSTIKQALIISILLKGSSIRFDQQVKPLKHSISISRQREDGPVLLSIRNS
jgi:hypothetical protein